MSLFDSMLKVAAISGSTAGHIVEAAPRLSDRVVVGTALLRAAAVVSFQVIAVRTATGSKELVSVARASYAQAIDPEHEPFVSELSE